MKDRDLQLVAILGARKIPFLVDVHPERHNWLYGFLGRQERLVLQQSGERFNFIIRSQLGGLLTRAQCLPLLANFSAIQIRQVPFVFTISYFVNLRAMQAGLRKSSFSKGTKRTGNNTGSVVMEFWGRGGYEKWSMKSGMREGWD